ncbi:uncharacterized protein V1513DRAFT_445876 [Lipomyces chichibuensis]|uniref:uncharacterized protein n=1 Tax=Lipomyces chichibuensis TaxID=1546026 RepID=UPI00334364DF
MDAACGPSTPLGALRKHATADRSLHQDRLVSQSSSSASQAGPSSAGATFRTSAQQEGSLDGGYAAFLSAEGARTGLMASGSADFISGDLASMKISEQQLQQQLQQHRHFERMVIAQQQDHLAFRPQQRQEQARLSSTDSWHEDFMRFLDGPASMPPVTVPQESANFSGYLPMTVDQPFAYSQSVPIYRQVVSTARSSTAESSWQDAAFKEEFDRIQEAISLQDGAEQTKEGMDQQEDDDGLAAIASELLESLKANQTQKFKDSTFLALMRRLRDKEIVVQGNKMVEAVSNGEYAGSYAAGEGVISSPFDSAQKELGGEGKFWTGAWEESF